MFQRHSRFSSNFFLARLRLSCTVKHDSFLTFQSLFCGWRGTRGRSLLPGRMCSGGVQSICSNSLPFFFLLPLSAGKRKSKCVNYNSSCSMPHRNQTVTAWIEPGWRPFDHVTPSLSSCFMSASPRLTKMNAQIMFKTNSTNIFLSEPTLAEENKISLAVFEVQE